MVRRFVRRLVILLAAIALIELSYPVWHAPFEQKQLRIYHVSDNHNARGEWLEIDGDNFSPRSHIFFTIDGKQVEAQRVVFVNKKLLFAQMP